MDIVLNKVTNTIHKQETGKSDWQTACGATNHLPQDNLKRVTVVEPALDTLNATKCGRCFDDAGGY